MDKTKYEKFIKYLVDNRIQLSKSVEIRPSGLGGVGVFALTDLPADTVLLQVPKTEVLSPSTCGIANLLEIAGLDGMIGLTVAYIFEKCQGKASPWFEYLETIEKTDQLPRFWSDQEKARFTGTEIDYMGGLDANEISTVFETAVLPFIKENITCFPGGEKYMALGDYIKATEQVCSRAFEVDVFRGLSLVPGACLFNHAGEESVHFESRAEVCEVCGEEYCDHIAHDEIEAARKNMEEFFETDDDEQETEMNEKGTLSMDQVQSDNESQHSNSVGDEEDDDEGPPDTCDIVTVKPISKGEEIFNTYGYYSNGVLLARYGFAIWDNPHETVAVGRELVSLAKSSNLYNRVKWWSKHYQQYLFGSDENEDEAEDNEFLSWQETLEILSSGELSPGLEKLLRVLSLSPNKFLATQVKAKKGNFSLPTTDVAKTALVLINKRSTRYQDGNMSSTDYKKVLDTTDDVRTRLTVIVRGTEKLVLERAKLLLKR
jgi:hypothetical protein